MDVVVMIDDIMIGDMVENRSICCSDTVLKIMS